MSAVPRSLDSSHRSSRPESRGLRRGAYLGECYTQRIPVHLRFTAHRFVGAELAPLGAGCSAHRPYE